MTTEVTTGFKFDKENLLRYCGWSVEGVPLRRHPEKAAILDEAEEFINNPDLLRGRDKDERGVTIALSLIAGIAGGPKSESQMEAAKILRLIGRRDLLTRTPDGKPTTNRTSDPWLWYWQEEPEDLIETVEETEARLLQHFAECRENHERRRDPPEELFTPRKGARPVYTCCLGRAFRAEFNGDMPKGFRDSGGDAQDYPRMLALRFLAHKKGMSFDGLRRLYFNLTEKGKLRPYKGMPASEALEEVQWRKLDEKSGLKFYPLDSVHLKRKKT